MLNILRCVHDLGAAGIDEVLLADEDVPALDVAVEQGLVRVAACERGPGVYRLTRRGRAILDAAAVANAAA